MKSIVNSQLTGKWYQIAKGENRCENGFVELMIYLSICYVDKFDVLYVGVKRDGSKSLKKMSLKVLTDKKLGCLVVGNLLFRKKFKMLIFDPVNGLAVISDKKMCYFSILSRQPNVSHDVVQDVLGKIDFLKLNNNTMEIYSDNIV